jgi:hypothetical protein
MDFLQAKSQAIEFAGSVLKNKYILYPLSVTLDSKTIFFIGKDSSVKYLFMLGDKKNTSLFDGEVQKNVLFRNKGYILKKNFLTYENLVKLKKIFPHLNPKRCTNRKSLGTGDRLGLVSAAHVKSFENKDIFPVLAQQSARELKRTERSWKDVINDATWGYFESGSRKPFGADADHVKATDDLKKSADCGFNMFTADPSDYIQEVSYMSKEKIEELYSQTDNVKALEKKYLGKNIEINKKKYHFDKDKLIPIIVKYSKAINYVSFLYEFLKGYKRDGFDFEVSMDEIADPTTPTEHIFIVTQLLDSGVYFKNLALCFIGRWEKAIDYMGDLELFKSELKKHAEIARYFGTYKLSLHSGSEKFSTYKAFSKFTEGNFHIKTAGTSYLEALRTIAEISPDLFRKIYVFSLKCFEKDRESYYLSTDIKNLPDINNVPDKELVDFLNLSDSRQILHVTFGSVLTAKDKDGMRVFKNDLYLKLFENEDIHYRYVSSNIEKHLNFLKN